MKYIAAFIFFLLLAAMCLGQSKRISEMDPAASLSGGELFPVVQGGANFYATPGQIPISGDVTGTMAAVTVGKIQGRTVAGTLPTSGQTYIWNSSTLQWEPGTINAISSATAPINYSSGVISADYASGSQPGVITAANFTTFNNKQAALSGTGYVKSTAGTISYDNSTFALDANVFHLTGDESKTANGATATGTADQKSSYYIGLTASNWNGSVATPHTLKMKYIASTATNELNTLTFTDNSSDIMSVSTNFAFSVGGRVGAASYGSTVLGSGNEASGTYSVAAGTQLSATGGNAVAMGLGFPGKPGTAAGQAAFFLSSNTTAATSPYGAASDYSGIFAGRNNNIPSSSVRCAVIGGEAITARSSDADEVYAPNFNTRHLTGISGVPGIVGGTGAGTSPTVSVSGTDLAGIVTVTTGTLPTAAADVVTIAFDIAYTTAPFISLTPANALTAALSGTNMVYPTSTTTTFVINAGTVGLTGATDYAWYYIIISK